MMKLLFVCNANVCRSVIAEVFFREWLKRNNSCDISVSSAGTGAFIGEPPTSNAVKYCNEAGVDISANRSRGISEYLLDETDLIYCMDDKSLRFLSTLVAPEKITVFTPEIIEFAENDNDGYEACIKAVKASCKYIDNRCRTFIKMMSNADVPDIARLEAETFSSPWSEKSLADEIDNPTACFFSAFYNGRFAGYIGANVFDGEVYINNIAVRVELRGCGIASSLLTCLRVEAIKKKYKFLTLEVRQSNIDAISLYERFGFINQGIRPGFYENPKENAIIMTNTI